MVIYPFKTQKLYTELTVFSLGWLSYCGALGEAPKTTEEAAKQRWCPDIVRYHQDAKAHNSPSQNHPPPTCKVENILTHPPHKRPTPRAHL